MEKGNLEGEIKESFYASVEEIGHKRGVFKSSSGNTITDYYDIRAVCLRRPGVVRSYVMCVLADIEEDYDAVACIGAGGAILLGLLAPLGVKGYLYNPKGYGRVWSPEPPSVGERLVLLDDVITTGSTLQSLEQAVSEGTDAVVVWKGALYDRGNG